MENIENEEVETEEMTKPVEGTDCLSKAKDLVTELIELGYPQNVVTHAERLVSLLEKSNGSDEVDLNKFESMSTDEMRKDLIDKGIVRRSV